MKKWDERQFNLVDTQSIFLNGMDVPMTRHIRYYDNLLHCNNCVDEDVFYQIRRQKIWHDLKLFPKPTSLK